MKNFTFYIFTFFTTLVFAQKPTELNWNYNDFINNAVNKVSKYSIPLRKNGKVKKRDSTLLFTKQIDLNSKTVFGIESSLVVVTHVGSHLSWHKFKDHYNNNGLILKNTNSPLEIEKTKEFGFIEYKESVGETIYEYDLNQNLKRKEYRTTNNHYSIYKETKDTTHTKSIYRPQIYEYVYNSNNQELKQFHKVDSARYLNIEWKYDKEKRLVEWISYTRENKLHTKRYYYYDNENRIKKQIDSTGWYVFNSPIWESTKTYEYDLDKTTETINNNTQSRLGAYYKQEVTVYDSDKNLIRECKIANNQKECSDYSYIWENGKLIERTETQLNGQIIKQKYEYNNRNLITEKSQYLNGKRVELIRYYYE